MSIHAEGHRPVMLKEVCDGLAIQPEGVYIDATFGRGGHTASILAALGPKGRVIAYDKDPEAIAYGRLHYQDSRLMFKQGSYTMIYEDMVRQGLLGKVGGVLMDLGVSSPQLDQAERGFSFMKSGPLDMRMDTAKSNGITAAQWLAENSERDIADALFRYGDEKLSRHIARAIVHHRTQVGPLETTLELSQLIESTVGHRYPRGKHPATRTFQALRIVVNAELEDLKSCLDTLIDVLMVGGRLVVISFHSLEHRLVKRMMQRYLPGNESIEPYTQPSEPRLKRIGSTLTASLREQAINVRARSAHCRIVEKRI